MKSRFLAFVFFVLAVDAVKALSCYQCDYFGTNEGFSETCKSKHLVDCPITSDVCFKVFAEGQDKNDNNVTYTIRGCGTRAHFLDFENDKCENKTSIELSGLVGYELPENFVGSVCICSDNGCNSSSMLKVSQGLMVILLCVFSIKKALC